MIKKLLLTVTLLSSVSAYCWDPYTAPGEDEEVYYFSQGYILIQCPCCLEDRFFPSEEFFLNRRLKLTEKEEREMVNAVTDYTGDFAKGRLCPFCGRHTPSDKKMFNQGEPGEEEKYD